MAALSIKVSADKAEVFVDGKSLGTAPLGEAVFVEPGTRTIQAKLAGYETAAITVETAKGGASEVTLEMKKAVVVPPPLLPPPRRSLVPGISMGGAAVAALAVGVGLMVDSAAQRSSAESMSKAILGASHSCVPGAQNIDASCPAVKSATQTSDTLHNAGVGVLIGAGALAAAAGVYFALPAPAVTIAPSAGKSGAGLLLRGSF